VPWIGAGSELNAADTRERAQQDRGVQYIARAHGDLASVEGQTDISLLNSILVAVLNLPTPAPTSAKF
jgi:hypothetical protein